jgi:hypothetical protein
MEAAAVADAPGGVGTAAGVASVTLGVGSGVDVGAAEPHPINSTAIAKLRGTR